MLKLFKGSISNNEIITNCNNLYIGLTFDEKTNINKGVIFTKEKDNTARNLITNETYSLVVEHPYLNTIDEYADLGVYFMIYFGWDVRNITKSNIKEIYQAYITDKEHTRAWKQREKLRVFKEGTEAYEILYQTLSILLSINETQEGRQKVEEILSRNGTQYTKKQRKNYDAINRIAA